MGDSKKDDAKKADPKSSGMGGMGSGTGMGPGLDGDPRPGDGPAGGDAPGEARPGDVRPDSLLKKPGAAQPRLETVGQVVKTLEEALKRREIDPSMLKDLGWTEADVQNFVTKFRKRPELHKRVIPAGKDPTRVDELPAGPAGPRGALERGTGSAVGGGRGSVRRDGDTTKRNSGTRIEQFDKKYQEHLKAFYESIE
jgi:hypothetical protein